MVSVRNQRDSIRSPEGSVIGFSTKPDMLRMTISRIRQAWLFLPNKSALHTAVGALLGPFLPAWRPDALGCVDVWMVSAE